MPGSAVPALAALAIALAAPPPASATPSGPVSWGANEGGQLGGGFLIPEYPFCAQFFSPCSRYPVEVVGLKEGQVAALAGGYNHSLAVLKDGKVMAWGWNGSGQLGDGSLTESEVPVEVKGLTEASAIAAGFFHSLALLSNGTVMAWGGNDEGQLGDGSRATSEVPVDVKGLTEATAIAAGESHSLALLRNGTVRAWGGNDAGQLGDGNETRSEVPVEVTGLKEVTAIAAGGRYSLALLKDGTVRVWGRNGFVGSRSNVPVKLEGLSEVAAIAGGGSHGLALLKDGTVRDWGDGALGALGDGSEAASEVPVEVTGLKEVTAIAGGGHHGLALLKDGKVMVWGDNQEGQLGIGSHTEGSDVPVEVKGVEEVTAIAAGSRHSLVLGTQLFGAPPRIFRISPIQGSVRGGTSVTIKGLGFVGVTRVMFGSNEATIKSNTETSIAVESPAGIGKAYVVVTTPSGTTPTSGKAARGARFGYKRRGRPLVPPGPRGRAAGYSSSPTALRASNQSS
jgi:alpha-tubulin suppressor-like RCC1 family protein